MAEMARAQGKEPGPTMKDLVSSPGNFVKDFESSDCGAQRGGHAARVSQLNVGLGSRASRQ